MARASSKSAPKKRDRINCSQIGTWLRMVERGDVQTCEEQKKLCRYVRRVFAEEELAIDFERLEGYAAYEKYFPFDLFAWEWFCFTLFMCVFRKDGNPRWPQMLAYMGRGAGKNGFVGFVAFCALTKVNGIRDYDVDICANSEEQAKTSFRDIWDILENTGQRQRFKKGFKWNLEHITCISTNSTLKYRTDNPRSKDGLRSGMVIFDEVHAYPDFKNIKVFTTGLGKKPHPRRLYVTTDGDVREGVLDSLLERSKRILNGEQDDNGFLPFICKLDTAEESHDPSKWEKANPSLPHLPVLHEQIRQEYEDFQLDPAANADFMTKRMNLFQGNPDLEVASWQDILATNREVPDMHGMPCVCGIDFARTNDFVSAVLVFREGPVHYVMHKSWVCRKSRDLPRIRAPLDEWESKGIIEYVDDVEVHPSVVTSWLWEQMGWYDVRKVAIDSFRHGFFMRELQQIGVDPKEGNLKLTRPSDIMKVQPVVNSLFVNQTIAWGDDPCMRWYTNNTKLERAQHGNYTYGKIEPKARKTDGFMAFIAAMTVVDAIPEYGTVEFAPAIVL